MPVPEERLYNPERLNRWFAVSSLLMTASILWMIQVDYDRPWRAFQDRYYVGKAALAHLDYLDAVREERLQELAEAKRRVQDAEEYVADVDGSRRVRLVEELVDVDLSFRKANGGWSRRNQVLDVTKNTYEAALAQYGPEHRATEMAHRQLTDEEDEVERLRKDKEHWEDEKDRLEKELKELDEPVRLARKRLSDLETVAETALTRDQDYRGVLSDEGILGGLPIVKSLINFPMLDFTAPKNTPGRQQVNQLVLPDVRQRLNYLESYTTDRCTTCHVAIDDEEFSIARLARKLERALPGINEALQRMEHEPFDLPEPPVPADSDQALPSGRVTDYWHELTEEQQQKYFETLLELVNSYLKLNGRRTIDLGQPTLAHPDLDLFVSIDSPHPMARMGCTVCHEGNSQETDFVQAAHTPATHQVRERWEEKYYIRLLGVPNITFETVEHYWDRPMHLPQYTEAGCAKCHAEITDIARFDGSRKGERINLGRYLFTTVGCVNCHVIDAIPNPQRVGPDLAHMASKLRPEFVQQWVFFPQKFRPSTRMPHFFMQENNRAQSANSLDPDPVLRTQTEVAAISKYLFAVSKAWEPIAGPAGVEGDAQRGRKLFKVAGCLACHANLTEFAEEWITRDIAHRREIDEETARYQYLGMTHNERVRYAMQHFVNERDTFLDPEEARFNPDRERNTPVLTRYAPELSGIGSKVTFEWLYSWLIEPTHYAPDTRMPSLQLTPGEAADIAAYLLTLTREDFRQEEFELDTVRLQMVDDLVFTLLSAQRSERRSRAIMKDEGRELTDMVVSLISPSLGGQEAHDLVSPMNLTDKKLMYLGNKMVSHYGCYACHRIPGFESATPPGTNLSTWAEKPAAQLDFAFYGNAFHNMREEKEEIYGYVYPMDAERLNYWSPIDDRAHEEVTHTHAAFAKHKMLNPRIWDREKIKGPYDKLKMPNFYFTEEEAEALTAYLLSRIPPRVNDVLAVDYEGTTVGAIARGRNLTRELNCIACHEIEDNAPTVQQYFRRTIGGRIDFDSINAPPSLWGEGAKVQHNWLHSFLKHVEPLRPWLQVRMPSFYLSGEQATTLVEYFAALSRRDAAQLADARRRIDEHMETLRGKSGETDLEAGADEVGADWYAVASLEASAKELRRWAVERKLIRSSALDPLYTSPERLREAHSRLLDRVGFMQRLYDVEYPFVEPPKPLSSKEYFELGWRFFDDMGCLKCHVLGNMLPGPAAHTDEFVQIYGLDSVRGEGDAATAVINGRPYPVGSVIDGHTLISAENVYYDTGDVETKAVFEGPNPEGQTERIMLLAPSAPNLSLTYQRLRRAWVFSWMFEPQWIQPGTKMPQNFPGGQSPFEGDPQYPGTADDHVNLLVDFLYHAGATAARADLPKIVLADEEEGFGEEEEFDEEEFEDD
jgi:mono/diheme cytochrome c family protein